MVLMGTGEVIKHMYKKVGNWTVTLEVTDDGGDADIDITYVIITEKPNVPPIANFSYLPLHPTTNDTLQFTDSSTDSDGTIVSRYWDFGDGTYSTEKDPAHQYVQKGIYRIVLNVTDNDGALNSTYRWIVVDSVIATGTRGTPGFELLIALLAMALILVLKRK